jgi:hypothetical protein
MPSSIFYPITFGWPLEEYRTSTGTVRNTHGKKSGAVSGSWSHLALEGEDKEYSGTQPLRDFQRAGENCHGWDRREGLDMADYLTRK